MDIYDKINERYKTDYVILSVCAVLNAFSIAIQVAVPVRFPFLSIPAVLGILCQLQLFFSVAMAVKGGKKGFLLSVTENVLALFISFAAFLFFHSTYFWQTVFASAVSIGSALILRRHLSVLRAETDLMYKKAVTDSLTGLVNHQNFVIEMEALIARDNHSDFAVVFIDVDNFKRINDTLGHQAGDEFLMHTVQNMQRVVDSADIIGRMGGDEFAILVPRKLSDEALYRYVAKIAGEVAVPFSCQNKLYQITASLGIARYPKDGRTAGDVIHQADMAMYRAKSLGKNRIVFFDEKMQESIEQRRVLERALKRAIEKGEMYLEYQPQYQVSHGILRGFEALVRWKSSLLGDMNPAQFIKIAEEMGFMSDLGEWILTTACTEYMKVQGTYDQKPILAVNISCSQINDPSFVPFVRDLIKKTLINPEVLEFEITEKISELSSDTTFSVLNDLKKMGIKISLDDFGTGFSSINALRKLPLDTLKIDSSFTRSLFDSKKIELIGSLIDIAHSLNLKVIAEGVEKESEMKELSVYGCDFVQGFLFGHTLPIVAL
mgnify:CR=1 FL=1